MKTVIDDTIVNYCQQIGIRESLPLQQLREETNKLSNGHMQIVPTQGALLAMLVQLLNVKNYLEIGVFTGYSALWVAQALSSQGKITALDISDEHLGLAQHHWKLAGVADKILVKIAPAQDTLQELITQKQQFEMAFIDANKAEYLDYYELCLRLIKPGGIIAIDNVLMHGQVLQEKPEKNYVQVIKQLNELLKNDTRVDICMLPIGDGLTLARKKEQ